MKAILLILCALVAGGAAGWWFRGRPASDSHAAHGTAAAQDGTNGASRKLRFYQSPMHPWITSPEPGLCTICGMKLVPVYEGEAGFDSAEGILSLGSNSVTVVGIASAPVDVRRVTRSLRIAGTLDDDDSRHRILSAWVEGRVESVSAHYEGAEITEGTELATLYSPALLAAAREYVVLAVGGEASPLLAAAELKLRQFGLGEAQIRQLPSTLAPGQRHLPWLSPMSGTVVKRLVYAGQWVKEGEPLFEIADFSTMWFKGEVYERDLPWLRTGQEVVVTMPSRPGESFTNRIAFIDPNFDMMTRSTRVRVEIPNPVEGENGARRFSHRVYAEARVRVQSAPVLAVPRSAILNPGGTASAWVELAPGRYQNRLVRLGRAGDEDWEIVEGLEAGERVVVQGGLLLDAQSQLRGAGGAGGANGAGDGSAPAAGHQHGADGAMAEKPSAPATPWTPAGPEDDKLLAGVLRAASDVAAALAKDDLKGYEAARGGWAKALEAVSKAAPAPPAGWLVPLAEAKDLPSARKAFLASILPWTPLALEARKRAGFETLKVYRCPMTARSFPGAPAKASWWQWQGEIRNPWFGADMLDCGTEVK